MNVLLSLLCLSLVVAPECSSLPKMGDSLRRSINSIISMAQTTLVHIKNIRTGECTVVPPVEGLTNIILDLGRLDNELQSLLTEPPSQIQADVSSLEGRARSFAQMLGCGVPARPTKETSNNLFPDSRLQLSLMKVQCYLEKFLLNKDKLKIC
uniref:Obesity factor n=1 Tax=Mola mola TaxID=94237 RepID=A0A3Q3VLF3_MOLML